MSAAADIDTDLEAFRAEARQWLEANFPPALKGKGGMMMGEGGPRRRRRLRQVEEGNGRKRLGHADLSEAIWRRRSFDRRRPAC